MSCCSRGAKQVAADLQDRPAHDMAHSRCGADTARCRAQRACAVPCDGWQPAEPRALRARRSARRASRTRARSGSRGTGRASTTSASCWAATARCPPRGRLTRASCPTSSWTASRWHAPLLLCVRPPLPACVHAGMPAMELAQRNNHSLLPKEQASARASCLASSCAASPWLAPKVPRVRPAWLLPRQRTCTRGPS